MCKRKSFGFTKNEGKAASSEFANEAISLEIDGITDPLVKPKRCFGLNQKLTIGQKSTILNL